MIEQEIPKYKKKKESSISKSKIKSRHKHDYSCECLVKEKAPYLAAFGKEPWCYSRVTYCSICGKIYNYCYWEVEEIDDDHYRHLTQEEVLEKYKHLEIIEINQELFGLKYIPLSKE